jgi:glucose-6-phosphate isomerase
MKGAQDASKEYSSGNLKDNAAITYAAVRNGLYRGGKLSEVLVNYEPYMHYFSEWWKQLYGESEGKDGKGIFPAAVDFTTDLHSMGQYIQDGKRMLFETFINVETVRKEETIISDEENIDGLNFMAGRTMDYVNKKALYGTVLAHNDGGVPTIIINVPEMNAYYFGKLIYMFEKACGISGYMLGVNPFNQPGVEAYKKNMFALLGKPGYEDMKEKLESRLK